MGLLLPVTPTRGGAERVRRAHAYLERNDMVGATLRAARQTDPDVVLGFAYMQTPHAVGQVRSWFQRGPSREQVNALLQLTHDRPVRTLEELDAAWRNVRRVPVAIAMQKIECALAIAAPAAPLADVVQVLDRVDALWAKGYGSVKRVTDALKRHAGSQQWFATGWWTVAEALLTHEESTRDCVRYIQNITGIILPFEADAQVVAHGVHALHDVPRPARASTVLRFSRSVNDGLTDGMTRLDTLRALSHTGASNEAGGRRAQERRLDYVLAFNARAGTRRSVQRSPHVLPDETTENAQRRNDANAAISKLCTLVPEAIRVTPLAAIESLQVYISTDEASALSDVYNGSGTLKVAAQIALEKFKSNKSVAMQTLALVWAAIHAPELGEVVFTDGDRTVMRYALTAAVARCVDSKGSLVCANGQNQRMIAVMHGYGLDLPGEAAQLIPVPEELVCAFTRELAQEHNHHPPDAVCITRFAMAVAHGRTVFERNATRQRKFETGLRNAYAALEWPTPPNT